MLRSRASPLWAPPLISGAVTGQVHRLRKMLLAPRLTIGDLARRLLRAHAHAHPVPLAVDDVAPTPGQRVVHRLAGAKATSTSSARSCGPTGPISAMRRLR